MELIDNKLIWKKQDQNKYYDIITKNYFEPLFKFLKNKPYIFYFDEYDEYLQFNNACKYFNSNKINIKDFYQIKKFRQYPQYQQILKYEDVEFNPLGNFDSHNIGFSIINYEIDHDNSATCGQCHMKYNGGCYIQGLAYNAAFYEDKLFGNKPIKYEGWIKTPGFLQCNCEEENDILICPRPTHTDAYFEQLPNLFLDLRPVPMKSSLLINTGCLFDLKYMKISDYK